MLIACPDCGTLAEIEPLPPRSRSICRLCRHDLEKTSGRSIPGALACSLGTFLLLIPANALPMLQVDMFSMDAHNVIGGGIAALWNQQWFLISACTALFVIVLPFVIFGLLSAVLICVLLGYRPRWLAAAFRWTGWLDLWGMPDVFLLAAFVGYYRLIHLSEAHVSIAIGGACFLAAGFLTMVTRAALDRRTVWRFLRPVAENPASGEVLSCTTCDIVQPLSREGEPCPRCGARLQTRKSDAVLRTAALTIAGFVLVVPANVLPMEMSSHLGTAQNYTIFTGVRELFDSGLWPLGILIFCTSIAIPVAKLAALVWCILSVRRRSRAHLVAKTKIFRIVAELGRWSKVDPFTIVFFVPLVKFGGLATATAGWGATAFMAMSILTMAASITFDPRLMWDAALASQP
jgi:paraquat-inducible protein A